MAAYARNVYRQWMPLAAVLILSGLFMAGCISDYVNG